MTLRVAIAGAGQAGERHAAGFAATAGAAVVGIADLDTARAAALAAAHNAAAVADWRELLALEPDILVVALPHHLHLEPAEAAAAAGIHVLMEKPIAITLEEGKRIVRACADAGVKLTLSFVHRFREELQQARRWLDDGLLGRPQVARETMNGQRGPHLPGWVDDQRAAGGGVLMYSAIHGIDRLRWLLGAEVATVTAQTRRFDPECRVEEGVAALLTFGADGDPGPVATLSANAPSYRAQPTTWETEIYGSRARLRLRTRHFAELASDAGTEQLDTEPVAQEQGPHYNFARQAAAFVHAISHDQPPAISGLDGLRALAVAQAIYRSADSGEAVAPEEVSEVVPDGVPDGVPE